MLWFKGFVWFWICHSALLRIVSRCNGLVLFWSIAWQPIDVVPTASRVWIHLLYKRWKRFASHVQGFDVLGLGSTSHRRVDVRWTEFATRMCCSFNTGCNRRSRHLWRLVHERQWTEVAFVESEIEDSMQQSPLCSTWASTTRARPMLNAEVLPDSVQTRRCKSRNPQP